MTKQCDRVQTATRLEAALSSRSARVTIWGAGFIGLSAATRLVASGFSCRLVDVNPVRVDSVNRGLVPLPGMEHRIAINPDALDNGRIRAMLPDEPEWRGSHVHLVCVNTERGGRPSAEALDDVLRRLATDRPPAGGRLIAIESTLSPAWLETVILPKFPDAVGESPLTHLVVAPRRDWMLSDDKDLPSLPRVIGAAAPCSLRYALELYSAICDQVHVARDWSHACLTKSVENLYRYIDLVLTNQLAMAYPQVDMVEVMRLAGTKWNVPTYHPSLGIGGYCIPLSPHFAIDGREVEGALPLVESAIAWSDGYADRLVPSILALARGPIGILGISYAPDVRITEGSPGVELACALHRAGQTPLLHDPFFTEDETRTLSGCAALRYPGGLAQLGLLIVATFHSAYRGLADELRSLPAPPLVLDNLGHVRRQLAAAGIGCAEMGNLASVGERS